MIQEEMKWNDKARLENIRRSDFFIACSRLVRLTRQIGP